MDAAWEELLRLLEHRDLSVAEAQAALLARGHAKTRTADAVRRAKRLGLLSDERVAQAVQQRRSLGAEHGILRVAEDLARRGVGEGIAERTLGSVNDEARCLAALHTYIARRGRPADQRQLRRLLSFLARQGYAEESVREALSREGIDLPSDGA